jgi:hypothetical protein
MGVGTETRSVLKAQRSEKQRSEKYRVTASPSATGVLKRVSH